MRPLISQEKLREELFKHPDWDIKTIFDMIERARAHEFDVPEGGYQVGDVVEWCGREGIVLPPIVYEPYPIRVAFKRYLEQLFLTDGRHSREFNPNLKFISRPAKCETHEPISATELVCRTCGVPIEASGWRVKV